MLIKKTNARTSHFAAAAAAAFATAAGPLVLSLRCFLRFSASNE
jgi:hypothetical protein